MNQTSPPRSILSLIKIRIEFLRLFILNRPYFSIRWSASSAIKWITNLFSCIHFYGWLLFFIACFYCLCLMPVSLAALVINLQRSF